MHLLPLPMSLSLQASVKGDLVSYYAHMGMMDALKLILNTGFKPVASTVCSTPHYFFYTCML